MRLVAITLTIALLVGACTTKDPITSDPPAPTVYGKWKVVSFTGNTSNWDIEYMIIKSDNSWFALEQQDPFLFKRASSGICQITTGQISFGEVIFNYTLNGNSLHLENLEDTYDLERDNAAPSETDWVATVSVVRSVRAPSESAHDLAFDGQFVWYGNGYDDSRSLYKLDLTSMTKVDSLFITEYSFGLAWDGNYLWGSSNGYAGLYKINPTTGGTITSSIEMGAWLNAVTYDGYFIWCYSGNENTIYKYNPINDQVVETIDTQGTSIRGMEFKNGFMYVSTYDAIHKCTLNPLRAVKSYDFPDCEGIVAVGSSFWISSGYGEDCMVSEVTLE